ncbi:uncharacterized protein N0V89_005500 [Didymosphaeria variabile]|uniref:Fungal-specific transcription factor domain-containing protein n=1 Tax=Didymosphaeria variabile TaxID=1932322 RepID=A0A9W8XKW0_9PLEO|nr:uncharacterized protein N0V89_005500 [Didymosphaeria variabile]KAJ4353770.1 hypothetical protein N0V89_005500 [Didymosphaeria variabile]
MMMSSPVVRQAVLCQSSFFFSLLTETSNDNLVWETVLTQTAEAFETLRKALQYIENADIAQHMHGTVRILASILQVQRFEIAVLSFDNCRAHLFAALALFEHLMRSSVPAIEDPKLQFQSVLDRLGPTSRLLPGLSIEVQSAEQAAFTFSTALLILDDIVASTILQEPPRLYEYHRALLYATTDSPPVVDVESVIGCQNVVLLQIGEASNLDTWKQQRKRAGNLDVMELVRRAMSIKDALENHLGSLTSISANTSWRTGTLLDQTCALADGDQRLFVTRIWGHAALLFLSVVVSGWQPANTEVQHHVGALLDLLDLQKHPPALLRSVAWPFCVAGCLAMPSQEARFRAHMQALGRTSIFGALRKASKIMEDVWRSRDSEDRSNRDLATFFRTEGDLVLLV